MLPETVWWGEIVVALAAVVGLGYSAWVVWKGSRLVWLLRISGHHGARETTFAGGVILLGMAGLAYFAIFAALADYAMSTPGGGFSWTTLAFIALELLFLLVVVDWPHRWERMKRQTPILPHELPEDGDR
jgi:hypothetical protein